MALYLVEEFECQKSLLFRQKKDGQKECPTLNNQPTKCYAEANFLHFS